MAQARVLLDALAAQIISLTRAVDVAERNRRPDEARALRVDLHNVRRYIERIHQRFPETVEPRHD